MQPLTCLPHYTTHALLLPRLQIVGAYQIGYHNRLTGKRYMDQVVVMQNLFHGRTIGHVFDLKGSSRSRYVTVVPPTVTAASTVSATPGGEGGVTASADAVRACSPRKLCSPCRIAVVCIAVEFTVSAVCWSSAIRLYGE
jgi:hypothetical protein